MSRELRRLLAWVPVKRFSAALMRVAVMAWHWVLAAGTPELQVRGRVVGGLPGTYNVRVVGMACRHSFRGSRMGEWCLMALRPNLLSCLTTDCAAGRHRGRLVLYGAGTAGPVCTA